MRFLSLMLFFLLFNISASFADSDVAKKNIWFGWGVAQTETFWAARAPAIPKWHLNLEHWAPFVFASGTAWESPLKSIAGVNGYWAWENGTQDFGEKQSAINGEFGLSLGPSIKGSIFSMGCELLALGQLGLTVTEVQALQHSQREHHLNANLGIGPGWYVGWGNFTLRQQTLLGYGLSGYHHELRLALGASF
tara:strand:+ start:194 stop:772 length:579 start_codon:yes stop_codon:yes gene_type:complete